MTSQDLWSPDDLHFLGITWHNVIVELMDEDEDVITMLFK